MVARIVRLALLLILWLGVIGNCITPARAADPKEVFEARVFTAKIDSGNANAPEAFSLPYRIMKPLNYDASAQKAYPLVIFLHGAGERGTDNTIQLVHGMGDFAKDENRQQYPCFVIAPQCPAGKRWVEVDWGADAHEQPELPSVSLRATLQLIDSLEKEFRIDASRLYVTGLSMGGYGTWDLAQRFPETFAAAAPVCGGGDEKQAARLAKLPIWAFHGDKDTAVKPDRSRNMIAAIKKAGGDPKYTEYPGVGHNSWVKAYSDPELMKWMFAQRLPPVDDSLKTKVNLKFNRVPLHQALDMVAAVAGVTLFLDGESLKLQGYTRNMPVSLELKDRPARDALLDVILPFEKMKLTVDPKTNSVTVTAE